MLLAAVAILATVVIVLLFMFRNGWREKGDVYRYRLNGKWLTGMVDIEGVEYYFDDSGKLTLGWFEHNGCKYCQDRDGLYKGERTIAGEKYFFEDSGKYLSGFYKIKDVLYYHDDHGFHVTGEINLDGDIYMVREDSTVLLGWADATKTGPYYDTETGKKAEKGPYTAA